jgi:small subunit ribosomal protein S20
MANTQSAKKRARQTLRRTARNEAVRSAVKTAIRKAREALSSPSAETPAAVKSAVSVIAKAGNKGIYHHRAVARKVSRLMAKAAQIAKAPVEAVAAGASKAKAKSKTASKSKTRSK